MSEHTPEPWGMVPYGADRYEIQGDHRKLAVVESLLDARLMAAAPSLYDAARAAIPALHRLIEASTDPVHGETLHRAILAVTALEAAVATVCANRKGIK